MFNTIIPVAACPQGKIWEFSTGGSWTYLGLSSNPSSLELLPAGCLFLGARLAYCNPRSDAPLALIPVEEETDECERGRVSTESKRWKGDGGDIKGQKQEMDDKNEY